MISVIVCSNQESAWHVHEEHVAATIGCSHEYIRIDNTDKGLGICAAYNRGIDKSSGEICVFAHEDLFFVVPGWGGILEEKFSADGGLGLVGVAGTQYLYDKNPAWVAAGQPYIKGKVIHQSGRESRCVLTVYSPEKEDAEVVVADGLFLAIRRSVLDSVRFDEQTFDAFHFYDLDICMQVRRTHRVVVTSDIMVKHFSGGSFDQSWREYGRRFVEKYRESLPASCTDTVPDLSPEKRKSFQSVWLDMVMSPKNHEFISTLGESPVQLNLATAKEGKAEKKITVVTGMHRSGTSCLAGLLASCGLSPGPDNMLLNRNTPRLDNQKGHFENQNVVVINEQILNLAGGAWYNPPAPQKIAMAGQALRNFIVHFSNTFSGDIVKDPRLSLTLEVWRSWCPNLGQTIVSVRHPLGVAGSLQKRNGIAIETGLGMWYEYNRRLMTNFDKTSVTIVDYDMLCQRPEEVLRALLDGIGLETEDNTVSVAVSTFFEKGLNHNTVAEEDTEGLPPQVRDLYLDLKSRAVAPL